MSEGNFHWIPVPPPDKPIVQSDAAVLGLISGLELVRSRGGRCANCSGYMMSDSPMVWVPDSVRPDDSAEVVADQCRRGALNGARSGWCLPCADALGKPKGLKAVVAAILPKKHNASKREPWHTLLLDPAIWTIYLFAEIVRPKGDVVDVIGRAIIFALLLMVAGAIYVRVKAARP